MLQNCGISIPALVPPHLERPRYASSSFGAPVRSSHGFPRSQFEPRLSISGTEFPSEAPFPTGRNERNYSDFLPELQASRSVAYPSWSSWRSRPQSVPPFLGHPYGGQSLCYGYSDELQPNSDDSHVYQQKRKRTRTTFSAEQLKKLEKRFHGNHYIVGDERLRISRDLNLSEAQVKVWFQNRRIKFKKEEELTKLGIKKKRKGAHHVKRWQVVTKNFGPESKDLFKA